jgi:hypothetical protein
MPNPLWFTGVCDALLYKVQLWYLRYEQGVACKDADFLTSEGQVVKKPTMYACKVALTWNELEHLERILLAVCPRDPLTAEVCGIRKIWKQGRLLPGNQRIMTLAFYASHVQQILQTLQQAKQGQVESIDAYIAAQKQAGKGPFEG